ncbi:hypothetical protein DUI87_14949 [Hirundo rustica rustica]|uniref:Uncharacterized protein n=1 Tax=Hirundo rustica rustica TaxID=333673 RepID=A0A3M0KC96_HIRRU|nr:hypothetical protein DUI87_14949 [Hirundo rustica rustica]
MELHGGAEIHLQPMENPTLEQGMPTGGCDPREGPRAGAVWEELQPGEGPMLENFVEGCLPWKNLSLKQGKSGRNLSPEEEGGAETTVMK